MRYRKYGNHKTVSFDGKNIDSKREDRRWFELNMLLRSGSIKDLRRQVPFELIPAQRDNAGKVIERAVKYIADFVYFDISTGETVVEDAKGFKTRDYIIKRKLMLKVHGIRIKEV